MQPRATRLHQILNEKIESYEKENPAPTTKWESFAALFKQSGKKGRERSHSYFIKLNAIEKEKDALRVVLNDVIGKGIGLNGSTVLKRHICEGLCDYYGIDLARIDLAVRQHVEKVVRNLNSSASNYCPDWHGIRDYKMYEAIGKKAKWPTQKSIKKNIVESPLHTIINKKIDSYLSHDNPKPKSLLQSCGFIFKHCGGTGRIRAASYKVELNAITTTESLLEKLLSDTLNDGFDLKGSTVFKRRLLEGLAEYYGIHEGVISAKVEQEIKTIVVAYAHAGVATLVDPEEKRDQALYFAVKKAAKWEPKSVDLSHK